MTQIEDEHNFLFKIAQAYYLEGATQEEVGRRFGISRIKVSRLLKRAREQQVVQINVSAPSDSLAHVELRLAQHLHLDELIIAAPRTFDGAAVISALGEAAAPVLLRHLGEKSALAVSWGATLSAVAAALPRRALPQVTVVQMLGGLGRPEAETHGADITRRIASTLGARPRMLASPGIVSSPEVRDALLSEPQVYDTLALAAGAQVALVGIGIPSETSVTLREGAILSRNDLAELSARRAVGDISLRYFDQAGEPVDVSLNARIIGLEREQIRRIPRVIAVAGGMFKFAAIRAALKGRLMDVLITDAFVARRLLEEIERGQL